MTLNQPAPASLSHAEVDPVAAHRLALREGMVVHRADPLNCETSVPALIGGVVMPSAHFSCATTSGCRRSTPAPGASQSQASWSVG
ncbi:hypothetical protein ASG92_26380 [Arthrobacter sp. Soil736]|nr:hypothetical protein ASG92_26380 [Arthrobacter sp. Soil736]